MQNRDISIGVAAVVMGIMIGGVALQVTAVDLTAGIPQIVSIRPKAALRNAMRDAASKAGLHSAAEAPEATVTVTPIKELADAKASCAAVVAMYAEAQKTLATVLSPQEARDDRGCKYEVSRVAIEKTLQNMVAKYCDSETAKAARNGQTETVTVDNDCEDYSGARLKQCLADEADNQVYPRAR